MTCKHLRRPLGAGEDRSEPPTSACFDCGALVPTAEAWHSSRNPEIALCEACFRQREARREPSRTARGRAKRPPSAAR
ncbi:MAG: hypothetical protein AABY63_02035, partial [candidate division NC10 bacterium]